MEPFKEILYALQKLENDLTYLDVINIIKDAHSNLRLDCITLNKGLRSQSQSTNILRSLHSRNNAIISEPSQDNAQIHIHGIHLSDRSEVC